MNRIHVISSSLRSVGYDPQARVLEIEFLQGSVYRYYGVPEYIHVGLMRAPSHGQYFNDYIKNGYYYYERVE